MDDEFYVDDGVTGADQAPEALNLHQQLLALFGKTGLLLCKWNLSEPEVLKQIDPHPLDTQSVLTIANPESHYMKTLGTKWNMSQDCFCLTIAALQPISQQASSPHNCMASAMHQKAAYAEVVYLRLTDSNRNIHISIR